MKKAINAFRVDPEWFTKLPDERERTVFQVEPYGTPTAARVTLVLRIEKDMDPACERRGRWWWVFDAMTDACAGAAASRRPIKIGQCYTRDEACALGDAIMYGVVQYVSSVGGGAPELWNARSAVLGSEARLRAEQVGAYVLNEFEDIMARREKEGCANAE